MATKSPPKFCTGALLQIGYSQQENETIMEGDTWCLFETKGPEEAGTISMDARFLSALKVLTYLQQPLCFGPWVVQKFVIFNYYILCE